MLTRRLLTTSLLSLLLLPACGGNNDESDNNLQPAPTPITCGEGTKRMGSQCVSNTVQNMCGEGTTLENGTCVADEAGEELTCGAGTILQGNICIPDEQPDFCGENTRLDAMTNRCVADLNCGEGTMLVQGACLSDDEVRVSEADLTEGSGENDPVFGGTPEALTLPAVGESVLAVGTLNTPRDLNNNGQLNQDVDVWQFEAQAGDAVRLTVLELGAGALGFEVTGPQGFSRQGPGYQPEPRRSVFLPYTGTYQIAIKSQLSLLDPTTGPVGSDTARYRLAVENLGGLMSEQGILTDISAPVPLEGALLKFEPNLYKFTYTAPAIWSVSVEGLDQESATPALLVLDGQGNLKRALAPGETNLVMSSAVADDRWLFVDWTRLRSDRDSYELRINQLNTTPITTPIDAGAVVSQPGNIDLGPQQSVYIQANVLLEDSQQNPIDQGLIVNLDATLLKQIIPVRFEVFSPSGLPIQNQPGSPLLFFAEASGTYLIKATNLSQDESQTITRLSVSSHIPKSLGKLSAVGDSQSTMISAVPGVPSYAVVELEGEAVTSVSLQNTSGQEIGVSILGERDLQAVFSSNGTSDLTLSPLVTTQKSKRIIQVANLGAQPTTVTLTAELKATPSFEVEPNNTTANPTPIGLTQTLVGELNATDIDIFAFTATQTALMHVDSALIAGDIAPKLEVLTSSGKVIDAPPRASALSRASFVAAMGKTYLLRMSAPEASSPQQYSISLSSEILAGLEAEDNNAFSSATPLSADGTSFVGVGTIAGATDEDWYELTLAQEGFVSLTLERVGLTRSPSQTLTVSAFGSDGTTAFTDADFLLLPAGKSYLRVTNTNSNGLGNTYRLRATPSQSQDLGVFVSGTVAQRTGTFAPMQTQQTFSFSLPAGLGAANKVVVWASVEAEVLDQNGNLLHDPADSGQFFGSAADGSLVTTNLPGGTYQVVLRGASAAQNWELFVGVVSPTSEVEPNNTRNSATAVGAIQSGQTLYIQGDMPAGDAQDFFTFSNVAQENIRIYLFQAGETVADLDLDYYLSPSDALSAQSAQETPQIIEDTVAPGTHLLQVSFVDDVGANSREYLLVIQAL